MLAPVAIVVHELGHLRLAGTSGLCIAVLWWFGRHLQAGARGATWLGLVVGTASGWALWMKGLGPWLPAMLSALTPIYLAVEVLAWETARRARVRHAAD